MTGLVTEEGFGRNVRIESDVKLKRHPCVIDPALKSNTDAFVFCVLPDDTTGNRCRIEDNTIRFNFDITDFTDETLDRSDVVIHSSKQVYIHGWSLQWCIPDPQHKGTLESETVGMCRLRKAIQKPFHSEEAKNFIERTICRSGMILQALSYGRAKIGDVSGCHSSVPRYGRITLSTRHTAANFMISFGISLRLS